MTIRLAISVSHPIQHFCPQYCSWAKISGLELKVFFSSNRGLTSYADDGFDRHVQWDGLRLDFPHHFLTDFNEKKDLSLSDLSEFTNKIADFSPTVLLVYGYSQRMQRKALNWAVDEGVPVIMIGDSELHSDRGLITEVLKKLFLPIVFSKVSLFLTVGDSNEAYYRRYGVSDRRLIRCFFPIDVRHYDLVLKNRMDHRRIVRARFSIPLDGRVVMMVGKFVDWKRQIDLVRFSNLVGESRSDVTVVLVGSGPNEAFLRSQVIRNGPGGVVFAGFVQPVDLGSLYCAADVYVHCSSLEPHSLAISEAIYCSLPVVVSDKCGSYGPTDDVQVGRNGMVYRCGDVKDLYKNILSVLDSGLMKNMAHASFDISRSNQYLAHDAAIRQSLNALGLPVTQEYI